MDKIWLGVFLLLQAVLDAKTQYVSMPLLVLQAGAGLCMGCLEGISGTALWYRFLPGLLLLTVSFFSGEKVGQGDGWLFVSLGVYLSAMEQLVLLLFAVFLAALWIIPFLFLRCVEKNGTLPFAPFVLAAYMGGCCYGWF